MLDDAARVAAYQQQTGRESLTDRQQRRVNHKRNHQSAPAFDERASKSAERAAKREARARLAAGLRSS